MAKAKKAVSSTALGRKYQMSHDKVKEVLVSAGVAPVVDVVSPGGRHYAEWPIRTSNQTLKAYRQQRPKHSKPRRDTLKAAQKALSSPQLMADAGKLRGQSLKVYRVRHVRAQIDSLITELKDKLVQLNRFIMEQQRSN